MIQIISFFICSIIFIIYLEIKKKKYKKLANSPIFSIIEREYNRWYSKENRGSQINKKTTSVFEIDQAVNLLKKKLVQEGINRNQIQTYIEFLDKRSMGKNGLFDIFVGILTFIGTNTFLRGLITDPIKFTTLSKNFINDNLNEKTIFWIFNITILVIYSFTLIFVFYRIIYIDDLHKESQKLFVLKRIDEIWEFIEYTEKINKEKAIKEFLKDGDKVIFTHLETNESKILDKVIGNTMNEYSLFFIYLCSYLLRKLKLQALLEWLLGIIFLILICFLSFAFSVGSIHTYVYFRFLLFSCSFVFVFIYYIFYSSFIDKYQNHSDNKKEIYCFEHINEKNNVKLLIEKRLGLKRRAGLSLIILISINLFFAYYIKKYIIHSYSLCTFYKEVDITLLLLILVSVVVIFYSQRVVENTMNNNKNVTLRVGDILCKFQKSIKRR